MGLGLEATRSSYYRNRSWDRIITVNDRGERIVLHALPCIASVLQFEDSRDTGAKAKP